MPVYREDGTIDEIWTKALAEMQEVMEKEIIPEIERRQREQAYLYHQNKHLLVGQCQGTSGEA